MENRSHFFLLLVIAVVFFGVLLGATGIVKFPTMTGSVTGSSSLSMSAASSSSVEISSSEWSSTSTSDISASASSGGKCPDNIKKDYSCTKDLNCSTYNANCKCNKTTSKCDDKK